jgi:metal-responsive CopG/Arc/MetJ family transcriptional regulator
MVFIGIDDGTDIGLKWLNKRITVEKNLNGINILRKLGIGFDYGFMLFQPLTTFSTLKENLDFLQKLCADGYNPVMFNKLRPYYETRVEKELVRSGRIKGNPGYMDYDFLEERMTRYYDYITDCFMEWLRDAEGMVNISRWARIYSMVFERSYPVTDEFAELQKSITDIISASNHFILNSMKEISVIFESGDYLTEKMKLKGIRKNIFSVHDQFRQQIVSKMLSMRSIAHDVQQAMQI